MLQDSPGADERRQVNPGLGDPKPSPRPTPTPEWEITALPAADGNPNHWKIMWMLGAVARLYSSWQGALRRGIAADEPEQATPWREEEGPQPTIWVWPPGDRPALYVHIEGRWQYVPVQQKAVYADGRIAYHVVIQLPPPKNGDAHRAYWWPQDGLRMAHGSNVQPERTA